MNKTRLWLIIKREFLAIAGKKSFIIMTLVMPIIMVLCGAVPVLFAMFNGSETKRVAMVDDTKAHIAKNIESTDEYQFVTVSTGDNCSLHDFYNNANGEFYAIVTIPENVLDSRRINIYSDNSVNMSLQQSITRSLEKKLTEEKVKSYKINDLSKIIEDCNVSLDVKNIKWDEAGDEKASSAEIGMFIGLILSFVTYMFVLGYGSMIMNSVIEEKTNRIVEVIVSSCKPMELLLGKIIGVALVGLAQTAVWAVLMGIVGTVASGLLMPDLSSVSAMGAAQPEMSDVAQIMESILNVNYMQILFFFILYFIGGFLLFASLFAGFGSAVDQASDASQFTTPIIIIFVVAMYAAMGCMENPDGSLAVWCSIIPFTSPQVMMIRLPYDVPAWQMILSLVVLYGTAFFCIYISGKIFRRGLLLYGKKNSFLDVLKWIK